MKKFRSLNCYPLLLQVSILLFSFQVRAIDRDGTHEAYILNVELDEMLEHSDIKYIYLGKEHSDLYKVISRINQLDNNENSIVNELQKHIEEGFSVELQDLVIETLMLLLSFSSADSTINPRLISLRMISDPDVFSITCIVISSLLLKLS